MAHPTAAEPLAVYRYKRKLTPFEWLKLGFWSLMAVGSVITIATDLYFSHFRPVSLLFPLSMLSLWIVNFPGWGNRKVDLQIHEDWIHCEVLPGKPAFIWFATMMEMIESDLDLRIVHLTDKGHANFSIWKANFEREEWPEIVAAITSAASRQSPHLRANVLRPGG